MNNLMEETFSINELITLNEEDTKSLTKILNNGISSELVKIRKAFEERVIAPKVYYLASVAYRMIGNMNL